MRRLLCWLAVTTSFTVPLRSQVAGVRGEPAALAAAERLLQNAGGREAWRARQFTVEERGFLRSGEVAQLRVSRDFQRRARMIENVTPTRTIIEWLSPEGGWVMRDGAPAPIAPAELAIELQGLRQEPYAIYHRLAHHDPALRVELREQNAVLYVYDRDERVLCWFQLDPRGGLVGWGNFYNGAINQHYYGPTADMGDANLPRWGAASNGSFRFEYVSARLRDEPLVEPPRTPLIRHLDSANSGHFAKQEG